ncbi:cyclin M2 [Salpingoeca rosetta]|uniref:Cyclin M2 n=1 Tax=Salpingoeca rosetta (strain ATCC 50818 / BSB-021) TaxID=946362 RepID=F2U849_SALR5|nr:cyclin M2 [Salpingoeca rosetta]EGD72954.1 cyclin M2 [Salpingoeca rosetta]|eukprot:XP_004994776.1 cyclin M2 [Salpingoeca rosetta]
MPPNPLICVAAVLALIATTAAAQSVRSYFPLNDKFKNLDGVWTVTTDTETELLLFGEGLGVGDVVTFTESATNCVERFDASPISSTSPDGVEARVTVSLTTSSDLYFCLNGTHQGDDVYITAEATAAGIPLPVSIVFLIVLLGLSGLFSGLNLGLMSLAPNELEVISASGEGKEQQHARTILPLRRRGNLLLCTVLLGNVLVNSTLAIFLDGLFGGLAGVLGSTAGIVIFGEIVPQSVCSRHALAVGAYTIWLTKFFMVVTFPIAYPISVVLDKILGDEVGAVYMRKQLLHLLKMQDPYNDLERDELDIITGALTYKTKTAADVMTKMEDVFMLDINSILDFKTVSRIIDDGHSRIPTYRGERDNIVGLLYVKDLAFIDPDDKTPLETVIKYYKHPIEEVYTTTALDEMLDLFKKGRTHMVMVIHINAEDPDRDPVREVVGIATLEDVIEEIIQDEIIDETDRYLDNKTKALVRRDDHKPFALPPAAFAREETSFRLSDNVALAVFTYLATQFEEFSPNIIGGAVLKRLLGRPECVRLLQKEDLTEDEMWLYREGEPGDFFTLVVEGSLTVIVGKDRLQFEAGPYHAICLSALTQPGFVCDFSARIKTSKVVLVCIPRKLYLDAVAASKITNQREHPEVFALAQRAEAAAREHLAHVHHDDDDDDDDDGSGNAGTAPSQQQPNGVVGEPSSASAANNGAGYEERRQESPPYEPTATPPQFAPPTNDSSSARLLDNDDDDAHGHGDNGFSVV